MYRFVFFLYLTVFLIYLLFSREPDYFEGDVLPAQIAVKDSGGVRYPNAFYRLDTAQYMIPAQYWPYSYRNGERVEVIVGRDKPSGGKVYRLLGYWVTWGELLGSVALWFGLFAIASAVVSNPTPESLIEQIEEENKERPRKRRYD